MVYTCFKSAKKVYYNTKKLLSYDYFADGKQVNYKN